MKFLFLGISIVILFLSQKTEAQVLTGSKYRYKIESSYNAKVLDVPGGSVQANTNIIQWHDWGGNNQKWYFTDAGNGYYKIHSINSYLVLDISGQSIEDSIPVVQNYATLGGSQRFSLEKLANNTYVIKASHSNKALDIKGASTKAGEQIIQTTYSGNSSQHWKITLLDSLEVDYSLMNPGICTGIGTQYRVHAKSDVHLIWDMPWASKQAGTEISLYTGQGATHQRCYFEEVGNQKYLIYMMHSGLVLQPKNGSKLDGVGIEQTPKNGSLAQQFSFLPLGDGYYAIINVMSGLALSKVGNTIVQSAYTSDIDQHWKLIMTEGSCNGIATGITDIQRYYTKTPENTCHTVRMFYVVPSDAPIKNRQALCAAAALSQQRTWAQYGYTVAFEPIKVINSTHDMNWFMTNGDNAWYSYGQNAEIEVLAAYPFNYNNERLLQFVEGVCSAAAGGGGSASIPGCMIDGMAVGEPNNYGVVGHELGHHMFGTGHPVACEKIFPQDNMCNNVYPASIIYPGSYTDNHIGSSNKWIKEKSGCNPGLRLCDIPTPLAEYKIGTGNWVQTGNGKRIAVELGKPIALSMIPDTLSYYRWYGPKGLIARGNSSGDIVVSTAITQAELGMYRCIGINNEGCSVQLDIILEDSLLSTVSTTENSSTFYIEPNPVSDRIFVHFSEHQGFSINHVTIYNQLGQAVKSQLVSNQPNIPLELDMTDLASGLYFISIEGGTWRSKLQKFVKI